jgi:hypothetical protein
VLSGFQVTGREISGFQVTGQAHRPVENNGYPDIAALLDAGFLGTTGKSFFIMKSLCHPELVSGSHKALILDAETSSA